MSWSLVTLSGRFCKNKILLGGRYSSGICTAGRLGAGAAAAPSTDNDASVKQKNGERCKSTFCSHSFRAELLLERIGIASRSLVPYIG